MKFFCRNNYAQKGARTGMAFWEKNGGGKSDWREDTLDIELKTMLGDFETFDKV
jgi:hypothetical protein